MRIRSKMIFGKALLVVAVMLMSVTGVQAQPYCSTRTFTIADGLGANTISDFAQAGNGLLWVSTWNGLCSYDGYSFRVFREQHQEKQVLSTNRINLIEPNTQNDLWCITFDSNFYLFDTDKCQFISVDKLIRETYKDEYKAHNVFSLKNGYTWMIGKGNVSFRIDERKIKDGNGIEPFDSKKYNNNIKINKIVLDENGQEWLFMTSGTYLYSSKVYLNYPFDFVCNSGDDSYLAAPNGLFARYDVKTKKVSFINLPGNPAKINDMDKIDERRIAIATDRGTMVYDIIKNTVSMVSSAGVYGSGNSIETFVDSRKRIWSFYDNSYISLTYPENNETLWLSTETQNRWGTTISKTPFIHEDNNNTVWIAPQYGTFSYFDEANKCVVPCRLGGNMPVGRIVKRFRDSQNNLWITGDHNLTLVNFKSYKFFSTEVLGGQDTRAIFIDNTGLCWVGMNSGHVAIYDRNKNKINYLHPNGRISDVKTPFSGMGVYSMLQDSQGNFWIGTKGDGIYRLSAANGSFSVKHFRKGTDAFALSSNNIYDIKEDKSGNIWVATYGGGINLLLRKDIEKGVFHNLNNTIRRQKSDKFLKMRRLTLTKDNIMIASTTDGIATMSTLFKRPDDIKLFYTSKQEDNPKSLYTSDVLQTFISKSGKIYVTTMGGGLQTIASKQLLNDGLLFDNAESIDANEGIIQSITEDYNGNLWLIREGTIDRYNTTTKTSENYGPNDWNGNMEFTEALVSINNRKDIIAVGTVGGFMIFNTDDVKKSNYVPRIVFSGVQLEGERSIKPIFNNSELQIASDKRNITVYFSAIDFSGVRNEIKYAYKIKELDSDWSYTDMAHSASLNHLPSGHYTLIVKSTNTDGVWMENESELPIYVHPTFWETKWAWALYLIIIVALIYAILYIYRLRNKAVMERQMKDKQLKFFTNISHQLRTPLTLISGPVRQVLENEPLSETAHKYMEFVDKNSQRMLELVDKAIDLKKLQDINDNITTADFQTEVVADESEMMSVTNDVNAESVSKISMLIVEDNEELRFFLSTTLQDSYVIYQARNGQEGLDMAIEKQPDFIITDIMMPVMDGMTMIRKIKMTQEICHIPIIVLSARTAVNYRIEGLNEGIDDYITKPFSVSYLKSRVSNIIQQRQRLQQIYVDQVNSNDRKDMFQMDISQITDSDQEFIKDLTEYINNNIGNADMKVDDIAKALGKSRTVFYVKLKSYFGMAPVDFIRHIRIQNAERMITETSLSFSEIAFKVGFTDSKYFGRCFKSETGMTPSEYRKKHKK